MNTLKALKDILGNMCPTIKTETRCDVYCDLRQYNIYIYIYILPQVTVDFASGFCFKNSWIITHVS